MIPPDSRDSHEHLHEYLRCLSPDKQAELLVRIERATLRGEEVPDADLILAELRRAIRNSSIKTERGGSPSRQFFDPVEPFIVDNGPSAAARGRIARNSLNPIWIWISRDLLPKEAKAYSDAVKRTLGAGDKTAAACHAEAFRELALPRIRNALTSQQGKDRVRDRLSIYTGPPRALADLGEIVAILAIRHPLAAVAAKLPQFVGPLDRDNLEKVTRALDEAAPLEGDAFIYPLLVVMGRLSERWQLVRVPTPAAAPADDAAGSRRLAVMLAIADTEDVLSQLRAALRAGDTATIGPLVRAIGGALTGLGSEVELSAGSSLALKLNAVRNEVRALLAAEIDRVPASVRRLLVFPTSDESGVGVAVAAVAAAERDVDMVQSVRPFAGALALGTDVSSALTQIRIWIEGAIAALLAGLRGALGAARGLFLLQISHAVRICAKLFGKQYASGIVAATERALRDERRAA